MSSVVQERENLTKSSKQLGLTEYWVEREIIENPAHRNTAVPFVWHWKDMQPLLAKASDIVPMEEAYRRALLFSNPGLAPKAWITTTMYGGCSWYNPGESAEVHRHPPSASRFILHGGDGGWTAVEGEKCMMARGDLILTPNGTWHNHGNDGKEPVIWVDLLDLPLAENLNNSWVMEYDYYEAKPGEQPAQRTTQSITMADDYSVKLYSIGGIKPTFMSHQRGLSTGSPMLMYRWADAVTALNRLREFEPDPCDGHSIEYINPVTGGTVVPTLSFGVQMHEPGFQADFQRKTSSTVYCVIQGKGRTDMDNGKTLEWQENDVFVVPSGTWYRHVNTDPGNDLMLYAVSDEPTLRKLGFAVNHRRLADSSVVVR
ncbi:MAG: cupin domain-containing protein [Pusillimonas sp.]|nr:cupin domain-containing protein [Pusillimonas sp.]